MRDRWVILNPGMTVRYANHKRKRAKSRITAEIELVVNCCNEQESWARGAQKSEKTNGRSHHVQQGDAWQSRKNDRQSRNFKRAALDNTVKRDCKTETLSKQYFTKREMQWTGSQCTLKRQTGQTEQKNCPYLAQRKGKTIRTGRKRRRTAHANTRTHDRTVRQRTSNKRGEGRFIVATHSHKPRQTKQTTQNKLKPHPRKEERSYCPSN